VAAARPLPVEAREAAGRRLWQALLAEPAEETAPPPDGNEMTPGDGKPGVGEER
jgi:hypothetical protein